MVIRLKTARRQEEQMSKVRGLMEMFNVNPNPDSNYYGQYQPVGGSSSSSNWTTSYIDPRIEKTRNLFEMFHLVR